MSRLLYLPLFILLIFASCCAVKHATGEMLYSEEDHEEEIDWSIILDSSFIRIIRYGLALDTTEWKQDYGPVHLYWCYDKALHHPSDTTKRYGITLLPTDDPIFSKFIIREYFKKSGSRFNQLSQIHRKQFVREIERLIKREHIESPYIFGLYKMKAKICIEEQEYLQAAHWLDLAIEACRKVHEKKEIADLYALAACMATQLGDTALSYHYTDQALTQYPGKVAQTFSRYMPESYTMRISEYSTDSTHYLTSLESLLHYYYNDQNPYHQHRQYIENQYFIWSHKFFGDSKMAEQLSFIEHIDSVITKYDFQSSYLAFFDMCIGAYNDSIWNLEVAQQAYWNASQREGEIDRSKIIYTDSMALDGIFPHLNRIGLLQGKTAQSREIRELDSIQRALRSPNHLRIWPEDYAEYVEYFYEAATTQYHRDEYAKADSLMEYYFYLCAHPDTLVQTVFIPYRQKPIEPALHTSCCLGYQLGEPLLLNRLARYRQFQSSNVAHYLLSLPEIERSFAWDRMVGQLNHLHNASLLRYNSPAIAEVVYDNALYTRTLALTSSRLMDRLAYLPQSLQRDSLLQLNHCHWQDIGQQLDSTEAAIEVVTARPIDDTAQLQDTPHYFALIITHQSQSPSIVDLCPTAALDSLLRPTLHGNIDHIDALYTWQQQGEQLYDLCIAPLLPHLKGIRILHIAKTGLLNRINLNAIPTSPNHCVMDLFEVHSVSSTSEVIQQLSKPQVQRSTNEAIHQRSALIYGGLDYYADAIPHSPTSVLYRDYRDGLLYLASSLTEADTITQILQANGCDAINLVGCDGTEASVKALDGNSPTLLHFATHVFYLHDDTLRQKRLTPRVESLSRKMRPLRYTGLHLSGSASAWYGHTSPPPDNDGLLTAEEISRLDLSQTRLAVLSACSSGLGEIDEVDGVIGLQRAFKRAGVQSLLMSLWPVPDEATTLLMQHFYSSLTSGESRHQALSHAMQTLRHDSRCEKPHYWAAFVLLD